MTAVDDLWTCPSCGKRFVTARMWHSCGRHSVAGFMAGKSELAWAYWDRLREMVGRCGPYSVVANKTRLAFMVRVRFAGMSAVSDRGMSFAFWLQERIHSPRFLNGTGYYHQHRYKHTLNGIEIHQEWKTCPYYH